jgi:hypothetical protein
MTALRNGTVQILYMKLTAHSACHAKTLFQEAHQSAGPHTSRHAPRLIQNKGYIVVVLTACEHGT